MGMHVDIERCVPVGFGGGEVGSHADAGIGEEQVNGSGELACFSHQPFVLCFAGDIREHHVGRVGASSIESFDDGMHVGTGAVAEHHGGAGVVKSFTKCRTDSTCRPCDNGDGTSEFHSTMLCRTCVSIIMGAQQR